MMRKLVGTYSFSDREIREALIKSLKANDRPAPQYVGDTPTCKWTKEVAGLTVEWTDEDEMDL
jgi:hypothetical protein